MVAIVFIFMAAATASILVAIDVTHATAECTLLLTKLTPACPPLLLVEVKHAIGVHRCQLIIFIRIVL